MFKSSRKRQKNKFNFEQQLNKQMNRLTDQLPLKNSSSKTSKDIVNMLDEVIHELSTPKQIARKENIPALIEKRQHQFQVQIDTDQHSIISIHSKIDDKLAELEREQETVLAKDHISNLVSNPQIVIFLKESYGLLGENDRILLIDFIKKAYFYFLGIPLRQDEASLLKTKVRNDLSTTDPDYVSLNALEIVSKRHKLIQYFQEYYIAMRIEIKISQYQKRYKKLVNEISHRQINLKEKQARLMIAQEEYGKNVIAQANRQKLLQSKLKEINLREKQVRKSIEEKVTRIYEEYINNFGEKIKQTQKRITNAQKNVKYKIQILQRRAETIRTLINEKNDLKNKKQVGDNEAKIKLRRLQKQFQVADKKYQAQLQVYQKQEKELMRNISCLQEKLARSEKKMSKQKEKILELELQLSQSKEKIEQLIVYNQQVELKIQKLQQQGKQSKDPQIKIIKDIKQKTNRSQKNKKKSNNFNRTNLISLYERVLQISQIQSSFCHISHQQLLSLLMKNTISQLPQLIYILTSSEDQGNRQCQPHYLVLTISSFIIKEFYRLNRDSQDSQNFMNQRMKSPEIVELLKYPYCLQIQLSFFILFIQIFDWCEDYSSRFFAKTIEHIIQQMENIPKLGQDNLIINHQIEIITSKQCCFYLISTYFTLLIHTLNEEKSSPNLPSLLTILISLSDLMLFLIKKGDESMFQALIDCRTDQILINSMISSISCILKIYSGVQNGKQKVQPKVRTDLFDYIEQFQELSEKLSILIQRIFYKFQKARLLISKIQKISPIYKKLAELDESNGHRHSFIVANLKSIIEIQRQSSI